MAGNGKPSSSSQFNLLPEESQLLDRLVKPYVIDLAEFEKRIEQLRKNKETRALLALLRSRAELYPEQSSHAREYAYVRSLDDSSAASAALEMKEILLNEPEDDRTRILLAFTLLRTGQTNEAEALMNQVKQWENRAPEEYMARAAVLAMASAKLLHEEELLLRQWVLAAQSDSP
jgi:thioredoxin-like negative regulator of GroEL